MSLLTAPIVKNSDMLAGIYFIFLRNALDQTWNSFDTEFRPQWKDRESSYQVRQNLALFCKLVALTLSWNCVKGIIVTKTLKKFKFEVAWSKLEAKPFFQRQSWIKYLRQTLVFMWNSAIRENFNLYF